MTASREIRFIRIEIRNFDETENSTVDNETKF